VTAREEEMHIGLLIIPLPKELRTALLLQSRTGIFTQMGVLWTCCHSVCHC